MALVLYLMILMLLISFCNVVFSSFYSKVRPPIEILMAQLFIFNNHQATRPYHLITVNSPIVLDVLNIKLNLSNVCALSDKKLVACFGMCT